MSSNRRKVLSRFAAMALLLGLIVLPAAWTIYAIATWYADSEAAIRELAERTARYRTVTGRKPALEAQIRVLEASAGTVETYLAAESPTIGGAKLQELIGGEIGLRHGAILSSLVLSAKEDRETTLVTVRTQMLVDTEALQRIFYELERRQPYLFLDNVSIRLHTPTASRQRDASTENADAEKLRVEFDAYAFLTTAASRAKTGGAAVD